MKRLKKTFKIFAFILALLVGYVIVVNRNSENMTVRQKVLKAFYPAFVGLTKLFGKNNSVLTGSAAPTKSFYDLQVTANNGQPYDLAALKGKKVLIANTASDCGYTHQYNELQALAEQYPTKLVVLGFPANDFKEQEKASDSDIESFCKINFGVKFPLMQKSVVINAAGQNAIHQWLTNATANGWNTKAPEWNFSKYLIDESGNLTHYFGPSVSPTGSEIKTALNF